MQKSNHVNLPNQTNSEIKTIAVNETLNENIYKYNTDR
jgi:hypothetical protein